MESFSEQRIKFFEMLFGQREGWLCFATIDPKAPKASFEQKFFEWPKEWDRVEKWTLIQEKTHNVYFCVNLLKKAERKKGNVLPCDFLWADLDNSQPSDLAIPPPIVVQSSHGRWQAYWRLTTELPPYQAEDYCKRLAYVSGADKSGWDLTQLLRVPFTKNFKYSGTPLIQLEHAYDAKAKPLVFEKFLPAIPKAPTEAEPQEMPDERDAPGSVDEIIYKYQRFLANDFNAIFTQEPDDEQDWSRLLWRLLHICLSAGMSPEETFTVARAAGCNKYVRDGRPIEHLWKDVLKAASKYADVLNINQELLAFPELITDADNTELPKTFVDEYREWATGATDAVVDFHDLCCFIMLSAIVANSVSLDTSAGPLIPNLWGLILGDSTLTRKTTAMRLALDFLISIEPQMIVATEGTAEGLLTGLSNRPNQTSVFYKDEISGFFESINRRDYLAGMQETLTNLYDVPPIYTRILRKETIVLQSPAFVFLGGGVTDRVFSTVSEGHVLSGFLPRFLVVAGVESPDWRPLGPATAADQAKKGIIANNVANLYENYATEVITKIGGQPVTMPPKIKAVLTAEAWAEASRLEQVLTNSARDSLVRDVALPTFSRLSRSLLKMAVILGATRQVPEQQIITIEKFDVQGAAHYVQRWGPHSIQLILHAGTKAEEKLIERIQKAVTDTPGIMRAQILRHHKLNKREADLVLDTLLERQLIRKETRGRGIAYWPT